jgi:hypothetical protein
MKKRADKHLNTEFNEMKQHLEVEVMTVLAQYIKKKVVDVLPDLKGGMDELLAGL